MNMLAINELSRRLARYQRDLQAATERVISNGWLVLGPEVQVFERAFAEFVGVRHCVGVANGTDAIELALRGLGVKVGDRVATVANAGMYTTLSVLHIGAQPYFMDVELDTHCVSVSQVRSALDAGVRAVVVTHLYGRAVPDIAQIAQLCEERDVALLEDCAQAHGARIDGRRVGSFGVAASFSFYPTKNLGALGDGGAVVCQNDALSQAIRELRQYGWGSKYRVVREGGRNSRLDELQAACLSVFLPDLDQENARRRAVARRYCAALRHPRISVPVGLDDPSHVVHLYVVRSDARASLREHLQRCQIATDVHYPVPDHQQLKQPAPSAVSLVNTEFLCQQVLTLPCHPDLSEAEVSHVIQSVEAWRP